MKNVNDFTVVEMLMNLDAESVRDILEEGIREDNEAEIYPALNDLLERGNENDVKDLILSMLANGILVVATEQLKEMLEFISERCNKGGELFHICHELYNSDCLEDFVDLRRLYRVYIPATGEYAFLPFM